MMKDTTPVFPGPIRQNAYLVPDLDDAMSHWLGLGIGPWIVMRSFRQSDSQYRGQPTAPVASFAFANTGELQIELIHQEDDSPSIYKEFTDGGQLGFHHIAFWSDNFEDTVDRAERAGWPIVHDGTGGGIAKFAYVDVGGFTSTVVEVMELNEVTKWMTNLVRDASKDWDGRDPVRDLG